VEQDTICLILGLDVFAPFCHLSLLLLLLLSLSLSLSRSLPPIIQM